MSEQDGVIDVRIEDREGAARIAIVTINRPAKLNALNSALLVDLAAALTEVGADDRVRAVVLTGAGERAFVGGADIEEMAALTSPDTARAFILRVHDACAAARDLAVPVIARINGYALGAGMELAAACDLHVASANAVFGMPEVKLGIPSVVEAALLPALVGWGRTREMLLLGETFGAAEAERIGLVEAVVPHDELDAAIESRLTSLIAAGPQAVRLQKALIRRWEDLPLSQAVAAGVEAYAAAFETDEPSRMMAEFRGRRR